ncbi:MAG: hypothetical protein GYA20_07315 [Chloroflexi bacterium]|nr:hypothetical protein [Chloroflexota bacterium]
MNENFPEEKPQIQATIRKFIKDNLIYLPITVTVILIIGIWIFNELFAVSDTLFKVFFFLVFLSLFGSPVLYIWRQEIPGPIPGRFIRGKLAIIFGVFELLLLLFMGMFFILYFFFE